MNILYDVQAHIDDLRRRGAQEQLATIAQAGRPNRIFQFCEWGRRSLRQGLIWLGSRLRDPVSQPVETRITFGTGEAACIASECC